MNEQKSSPASKGRVALTFFFRLMEYWNCSIAEQKILLGSISSEEYSTYRLLQEQCLPNEVIERISYLMAIHKSLRIIFSCKPENAYTWIKQANKAAPFNGLSALNYMLAGDIKSLAVVRQYLEQDLDITLSPEA